ncbi:Murein DD-endopeptidase MepM [Fervidicola ferrireducens]|uniref:Murein DD-endopeptidase MepM n=1 Tax=Fervidicola ferrireducens TaxID=520764 RepID=A0A140L9S1_9FIRM|nr:M23 family metallopeptidase [Fervidicola ferrireducens]KXG77296.1 Murein DD-endopeptidase MepM [Fervidicola ferrireducens]
MGKQRASNIVGLILTLFFLITSVAPAGASDLENLKNQQSKISKKIQEIRNSLIKVNAQKNNVVEELEAIEKDLQETQRELAATETQLKLTQQKLAVTQQELKKAEEEVKKQEDDLKTRLRAMYKAGPVDYLEVMLEATSFSDFLTRIDMVKRLLDYDKGLLMDYQAKKELVEKKKAELEAQRQAIARQYQIINTHRAKLASRQQDRQRLLAVLEEQRREYERQQDQLEEESRKIAEMIRQIQARSSKGYVGTGIFQWPVPSSRNITSDYGWRVHPVYKSRRFHTGIDIGAPMGANVVAADDGEVIYAGYYGGYGNTIIVDHGGGISTLYAHLSKILVGEGQSVKRGERIGLVGSTGISTGPHLHFEVRKDGQHVSPWNWVK